MEYKCDDKELRASDFMGLAQKIWPGNHDLDKVQMALGRTINITARLDGELIGCCRVLTDGYLFGTIPEILVDPRYQGMGIGKKLMEMAWDASPVSLFFGAQPGKEPFFEKLGYERSMTSFCRRKPRPVD